MRWFNQGNGIRLGTCATLAICSSMLLSACRAMPPLSPTVAHVALMWLKHPERSADRAQLIRAARSLHMIPGVQRVQADGPLPPLGPRAPRGFDLAVVIAFRDRAALQRYRKDPRHLDAMRRYLRPLVGRYEIYDLGGR